MPATFCANSSAPTNSPAPGEINPALFGVSFIPNMQWSAKQMDALFAIARQKAEQKLQVVTARACRDKKESATRITAICTPANAIASASPI